MRASTLLAVVALAAIPALAQQSAPGQSATAATGPVEFRTVVGDKPIESMIESVQPNEDL